jgi:hypothetical protein
MHHFVNLREALWETDPAYRSPTEWLSLLETVRISLGEYLQLPVMLMAWWVDNESNDAYWSITAKIKIPISKALGTFYVGALSIQVTRKKDVQVDAVLLLFAAGVRQEAHSLNKAKGADVFLLQFEPAPGSLGVWATPKLSVTDDSGWERFQDEDGIADLY